MTLDNLIKLIVESGPDDWHRVLETDDAVAVYKADIAVSMARAVGPSEDFETEWSNKFDAPASSYHLDILYNGRPVHRDILVAVDGGRCSLPLPRMKPELSVPKAWHAVARLVYEIGGGQQSDFDRYFGQAGLKIADTKWPERAWVPASPGDTPRSTPRGGGGGAVH